MKRVPKSTLLPLILLIYLTVMAKIGYDGVADGHNSWLSYIATISATLAVIILLHFVLKRRERFRRGRSNNIDNTNNSK